MVGQSALRAWHFSRLVDVRCVSSGRFILLIIPMDILSTRSPSDYPCVLLESFDARRHPDSWYFTDPVEVITVAAQDEVVPALERIQAATAEGLFAAGCLSYEAAAGLESVAVVHEPGDFPLLWFGIFRERHAVPAGSVRAANDCTTTPWQPDITEAAYRETVHRIRRYLEAGDTYQINLTYKLHSTLTGDDFALYRRMTQAQRAGYCAYVNTGRWRVLSASPELFFALHESMLTACPMKGTMPRGRYRTEDDERAAALADSEKDRSENLMIVDLLRNDLGRVSDTGSVTVEDLFQVERYDTVWQMTSTIRSQLRAGTGLPELFRALFPCGSVTGAPKLRSMAIIRELEPQPRRIFTGCIGFVGPGSDALFNVAIRTVLADRESGALEFGVGSGITIGSTASEEYAECAIKTQFLIDPPPDFQLLETLLYERAGGYFLLDRHMARLGESAGFFGIPCDVSAVRDRLDAAVEGFRTARTRVRLLLARDGTITVERQALVEPPAEGLPTVGISPVAIDSSDVFLYHKTTRRDVYRRARAARTDCDYAILCNERGEVTESDIANVAALLDGTWWTPPVTCGLLAGTYRAQMLAEGRVQERILTPADLRRAESIALLNAVRQWLAVRLVDTP